MVIDEKSLSKTTVHDYSLYIFVTSGYMDTVLLSLDENLPVKYILHLVFDQESRTYKYVTSTPCL